MAIRNRILRLNAGNNIEAVGTDFTLRFFWVFFFFSRRIKHQHLTFSVAVRSSLVMVSCVAMVKKYDVISINDQANFKWKYMFSQLFSTIKVNLEAKIMESAYLCVSFHVKHKKIPLPAVLTWFLIILGKIQEGDHCWWRHRPPAAPPPMKYTSSSRGDQRLSSKG